MAVDMFLKIDNLEGESEDHKYKGWIDVLAWSWGMSQSGTMHIGGGGGSGKVNIQDVSATKYVDNCSTELMIHCSNGKHFKKANMVNRKAGENPLEYIKVELLDVLISSVSTGGSGGEDRLTENVTMNFKKCKVEYTPQKADGTAGKTKEYSWDVSANKAQ